MRTSHRRLTLFIAPVLGVLDDDCLQLLPGHLSYGAGGSGVMVTVHE